MTPFSIRHFPRSHAPTWECRPASPAATIPKQFTGSHAGAWEPEMWLSTVNRVDQDAVNSRIRENVDSRLRGNDGNDAILHSSFSSFPRSRVGMQTCLSGSNHSKAVHRFPRRSMGTRKINVCSLCRLGWRFLFSCLWQAISTPA